MNRKYTFYIWLYLVIISCSSHRLNAQTNNDWTLYKSTVDLQIYTRPNIQSGIKEIRIKTKMTSSLQGLMAALNDVAAYPEWVYKCAEAKKLKTISEQEFYYYTKTDMPFPVSDRDLVVHSRQWQDKSGVIHSKSVAYSGLKTQIDGIVRIPLFESRWVILANGDGTVSVDYQVKTDPGGYIPVWLINLGVASGPIKTMQKLQEIVQEPKYQQANFLTYIVEL